MENSDWPGLGHVTIPGASGETVPNHRTRVAEDKENQATVSRREENGLGKSTGISSSVISSREPFNLLGNGSQVWLQVKNT